MTRLSDVVGAVIGQIGKGRSQADIAALEVAQAYKDHPLLKEFPVPRLTLDEVVIDLKMSVSATPAPQTYLTTEARDEILSKVGTLVDALPEAEPSVRAVHDEFPGARDVWAKAKSRAVDRVAVLFPIGAEIDAKLSAEGAASMIIDSHLSDTITDRSAKVGATKAMAFLRTDAPQVESRLAPQIREIIEEALQAQPAAPERLDVLVTASELQAIPPEKITTMRLTLRESDRSWTEIETEEGETISKLVPY